MRCGDQLVDLDRLTGFLAGNGYSRCSTVMEPGDYAVRGGIVDLYAPGTDAPVRLDLFGDTLESIRPFDAESQRTTGQLSSLDLTAAGEVHLDAEAMQRFRRGYVDRFGTVMDDDPLYAAISDGARHQGMEHWLPLFHDAMETLFDHCGDAVYVADGQIDSAYDDRIEQIEDYYDGAARCHAAGGAGRRAAGYAAHHQTAAAARAVCHAGRMEAACRRPRFRIMDGFVHPEGEAGKLNLNGRAGRNFAAERKQQDVNLFDAVVAHLDAERQAGRRLLLVASSAGAQDRLASTAERTRRRRAAAAGRLAGAAALPAGMAVCGMDNGFDDRDAERADRAGHPGRPHGAPPGPQKRRKTFSPRPPA